MSFLFYYFPPLEACLNVFSEFYMCFKLNFFCTTFTRFRYENFILQLTDHLVGLVVGPLLGIYIYSLFSS